MAYLKPDTGAITWSSTLLVAWFFLFLPAFAIIHLLAVRPIANNGRELMFSSASQAFADALKTMLLRTPPASGWDRSVPGPSRGSSFSWGPLAFRLGLLALGGFLTFREMQKHSATAPAPALPVHARTPTVPQPVVALPIPASHPAAVLPQADGEFIPAPQRVDIVADSKRNLLYITAADSVLRYDLGSKRLLTPWVLGGNLRALDLSADENWLAVADGATTSGEVWFFLINITNGTRSRIKFAAERQESGTYALAFAVDGGIWISSSANGSARLPLRRYDLQTHVTGRIGEVWQDTMLMASADRRTIAFVQAGISLGRYGEFGYRAKQLPEPQQLPMFLFEIGISREGTQLAVPTHDRLALSGAPQPALEERDALGVAYHPLRDYLFVARTGISAISVFDSTSLQKVKELEFGYRFKSTGARALREGRLRLSRDGHLVFCTVEGGVRYASTGL